MEARLLLGSDDTNGDSGHGSDEGWEGQPWARRRRQWDWTQGTAVLGLLAQGTAALRASGHKGEGVECGVACWPTPPLFK